MTFPVLLAQLDRMGVQPLLDKHVPTHGHWVGLSLGWVTVVWLTHILSEADHRLNHVAPWATTTPPHAAGVHRTAGAPVGCRRRPTGNRAGGLERRYAWRAVEGALNQHTRRVYDLQPACVRLDRTTASGDWSVTEDGCSRLGIVKTIAPTCPRSRS